MKKRRRIRTRESVATIPPAFQPVRAKYRCPIAGCTTVFQRSRGGWDAHIAPPSIHPQWHPDITDGSKRKELFKAEHPDWFSPLRKAAQ